VAAGVHEPLVLVLVYRVLPCIAVQGFGFEVRDLGRSCATLQITIRMGPTLGALSPEAGASRTRSSHAAARVPCCAPGVSCSWWGGGRCPRATCLRARASCAPLDVRVVRERRASEREKERGTRGSTRPPRYTVPCSGLYRGM